MQMDKLVGNSLKGNMWKLKFEDQHGDCCCITYYRLTASAAATSAEGKEAKRQQISAVGEDVSFGNLIKLKEYKC